MDKELIMALVGIGVTVVLLGVLAVIQQSRMKREKEEKVQTARRTSAPMRDAPAGATPFFISRFRGNKARFFRVYPDGDSLMFLSAGPFVITIDAETPRGTDRRHWVVRSAKLLAAGFAVGAVGAIAAVVVIGRAIARNPSQNPTAASSIMLGVIGIFGLLGAGLVVVVPAVVWRISRRAAELDALTLHELRVLAESDELSFRAAPDETSDVKFTLMDLGGTSSDRGELGATLTFRHKPTGKWKIETTTTRDTRDAIAAFRKVFTSERVKVDAGLEDRLAGRVTTATAKPCGGKVKTVEAMPRGYGFPLWMLAGFGVGAAIALATTYIFSQVQGGKFSYVVLVRFLLSLGALGTYTGHVIGAAKNPEKGLKPLGMAPFGAWIVGGVIVFGGTAALFLAAWLVLGQNR